MAFERIYDDWLQRQARLSAWIREHLDREFLGASDLDGLFATIRTSRDYPHGVWRFGFFEFKSRSPIMGRMQYVCFNNLHALLRAPAVRAVIERHYAGFFLVVYQAPFTVVEKTAHGVVVTSPERVQGVSKNTVSAICSLRMTLAEAKEACGALR